MTPQELYDELYNRVEKKEISLNVLFNTCFHIAAELKVVHEMPILNFIFKFIQITRKTKKNLRNQKK